MAEIRPLTVEEVDAHLDKHLPAIQSHVGHTRAATAPKLTVTQLCGVWTAVRPVLATIVYFPFIPRRWRDAVTALIGVVDGVCATTE